MTKGVISVDSSRCAGCGACAYVCPTGCITVVDAGGVRHEFSRAGAAFAPSRRGRTWSTCAGRGDSTSWRGRSAGSAS